MGSTHLCTSDPPPPTSPPHPNFPRDTNWCPIMKVQGARYAYFALIFCSWTKFNPLLGISANKGLLINVNLHSFQLCRWPDRPVEWPSSEAERPGPVRDAETVCRQSTAACCHPCDQSMQARRRDTLWYCLHVSHYLYIHINSFLEALAGILERLLTLVSD